MLYYYIYFFILLSDTMIYTKKHRNGCFTSRPYFICFSIDDDNRVILKTDDKTESDYINASYIHVSRTEKNVVLFISFLGIILNDYYQWCFVFRSF